MLRIKVFSSYDPDKLEDECNEWLKEINNTYEYVSSSTTCSHNGLFMLTIFYIETECILNRPK